MEPKTFALFGAMTLFAAHGVKAQTPEWKTGEQIIKFDVGPNGTLAASINPRGETTGYYYDARKKVRGFLRDEDGKITSFEAPHAGIGGTYPTSINRWSEITGWFYDASGKVHGFLRKKNGKIKDFDASAPPVATRPTSINSKGVITGNYISANHYYGFVRAAHGSITTFEARNATSAPLTSTVPMSINSEGVVTGVYFDVNVAVGSPDHGFVRAADGTITSFDGPGAGTALFTATVPLSINSEGVITGWYAGAGDSTSHGFVRASDGTITSFDVGPEGNNPTRCNPSGEITGWYGDAKGVHGFVRASDGTITSFDVGPHITYPQSINPRGEVTGWFYDESYKIHSFLRRADHHEGSEKEGDDESGEDYQHPK